MEETENVKLKLIEDQLQPLNDFKQYKTMKGNKNDLKGF